MNYDVLKLNPNNISKRILFALCINPLDEEATLNREQYNKFKNYLIKNKGNPVEIIEFLAKFFLGSE